jgi:hypothetical protein
MRGREGQPTQEANARIQTEAPGQGSECCQTLLFFSRNSFGVRVSAGRLLVLFSPALQDASKHWLCVRFSGCNGQLQRMSGLLGFVSLKNWADGWAKNLKEATLNAVVTACQDKWCLDVRIHTRGNCPPPPRLRFRPRGNNMLSAVGPGYASGDPFPLPPPG